MSAISGVGMRSANIEAAALVGADGAGNNRAAVAPVDAGGVIAERAIGISVDKTRDHYVAERCAVERRQKFSLGGERRVCNRDRDDVAAAGSERELAAADVAHLNTGRVAAFFGIGMAAADAKLAAAIAQAHRSACGLPIAPTDDRRKIASYAIGIGIFEAGNSESAAIALNAVVRRLQREDSRRQRRIAYRSRRRCAVVFVVHGVVQGYSHGHRRSRFLEITMRAGHIERPALRPADCAGAKRAAIAPIDAGGEIGSLRNGRSINVSRHFAAELQALLRGNRYAGAADGAHAPNAAAVKFCEPQPAAR